MCLYDAHVFCQSLSIFAISTLLHGEIKLNVFFLCVGARARGRRDEGTRRVRAARATRT